MHKIFLEVIAAPEYDEDALQVLKTKKNLRVLKFHTKPICKHQVISVDGGLLVQSVDDILEQELKVVTNKQPSSQEKQDLLFAMKVVK
jgi:phosphoribosylaminoimidazolecarboxamide formyltransferase/IMP cyclohydrolase